MDVLGDVNQLSQTTRNGTDVDPIRVQAPHAYDGIGQALRSAYRDHRDPPDGISSALRELNALD